MQPFYEKSNSIPKIILSSNICWESYGIVNQIINSLRSKKLIIKTIDFNSVCITCGS